MDPTSEQFPRKFGKYHLLAPLAQGGMGALYLAVAGDRGLEKLLVIKTVLPHLADTEYVARFRDEAKVVVKLSHGNLIPVFDAGQVSGELFLAMDFVEGKDLRAVWNRCAQKGVAFPVDVAVYIVKELCRGLGYAHGYGDLRLVHRDVSPPNVLISYSGEVKLTDFGLAASTLKLEKTAPGIIYGKVSYMSPEQARGEQLDGRSDLYAAGIILWELLTGRQLFPPGKEQPQDLLRRARNPAVVPPSQRAPRVPTALDAICLRALGALREERFASGEELRDALGAWLAAESPTTDAARMERFLRMLFAEDIERERDERQRLLDKTRERVRATLPPSDELWRIMEQSAEEMAAAADRRREMRPGPSGERADRRQQQGRRQADKLRDRVAVSSVVVQAQQGRTVVDGPDQTGMALAHAQARAQATRTDFTGLVLDGRYRVEELIGEGGMGRVYLAEHVEIGRRVAIKILHPVYGRMPDLVERFRREARAASRIGHPHIVDVTDSGTTEDGSVYFVMEYLEGVELASVIDREGALDVARALRITTQICRALSAAHAVGIIHRDLKPENVFLTVREGSSDFVKVLDFGIAKSTEAEEARGKRLTHPGMAMGTPEYMSPEQAAGRPADERCDVYAVGAILYEMLTGVPPYEGDNFMEILTKKATVDPQPPSAVRPELPAQVEALVLSAMGRDPAVRPPSMEAFEYELTKCLAGRGAAVAKILGIQSENPMLGGGMVGYLPRDEVTPVSAPGAAAAWRSRAAQSSDSLQLTLPRTVVGSTPPPVTAPAALDAASAAAAAAVGSAASDAAGDAGAIDGSGSGATAAVGSAAIGAPEAAAAIGSAAAVPVARAAGASGGVATAEAVPVAPPLEPRDDAEMVHGWVPDLRGPGLRLFGWGVLVLLLLAGAGAVLLALDSERGTPDPDRASRVESAGPPAAGPPAATAADRERTRAAESAERVRPATPRDRAETREGERAGDRRERAERAEDVVPRSAPEARALLEAAAALVSRLDWDGAKDKYELVAAGKFHRNQAYLGLAKVAFETKRADDAIAYARRAGNGIGARVLLGHAYYQKRDFAAALRYYESVLREDRTHTEAQNGAKAARDNLGKATAGSPP
ncbi:MAG TPA: protein kinase [Kofleriaceae bacterium]|nr:protein kinase [Kofleriaceae bacterium]